MPVHSIRTRGSGGLRNQNAAMQSNQITRCPDCETAFQVTKAQLEAAQGSVRCGSCLHTFDARDCLVTTGTDFMLQEPSVHSEQGSRVDPDAQRLNDPGHGPEILSVLAEDKDSARDLAASDAAEDPTKKPRRRVQIPDSIAHGPLELQARKTTNLPRLLGWALLNLLLILTLIAQLAYLYFDSWRSHAWSGAWIEKACAYVDCPAPRRNDLDLLGTSDLRVRSHPELSGMLVVELTISNRASFSQPLPILEIEFIDVLGSAIEARRIRPEAYLPGFDARADFLHAASSVQILLETPDPGDHAVNYILRLHPAPGN